MKFILILLVVFLANFLYDLLSIYFIKKFQLKFKEDDIFDKFEEYFK